MFALPLGLQTAFITLMARFDNALQNSLAAVTMVRGDMFFLRHWVKYYGNMLGRKACYVITHGFDPELEDIADGCNILCIPFRADPNFDVQRWRLINNVVHGLLSYYSYVVVGDVDEVVVTDPDMYGSLFEFVATGPAYDAITPIGLEPCHLVDDEPEPIKTHILGPRRFVRPIWKYSKPAILSQPVKLSRGGHFAKSDTFHVPDGLYLLHLKHCDFSEYSAAMDRRNQFTGDTYTHFRKASVGRHWFKDFRGEDTDVFATFAAYPKAAFSVEAIKEKMRSGFEPRSDSGFWQAGKFDERVMMELPERFFGLV
ncbi:MAG: glycosyltransferase family 2 protein [Pseudomonadota bacterium]